VKTTTTVPPTPSAAFLVTALVIASGTAGLCEPIDDWSRSENVFGAQLLISLEFMGSKREILVRGILPTHLESH
jgi:hypothetical protein